MIAFFSIYNFVKSGLWYQTAYAVCFPFWIVTYSGSLRVIIAYMNWERWQVILYKLVVLLCGLIFFYVGYRYMMGAYKVTGGYFSEFESTLKNMVYLYVFGLVQLFFGFYLKLSEYDQTKYLKYEYRFSDVEEEKEKLLSSVSLRIVS